MDQMVGYIARHMINDDVNVTVSGSSDTSTIEINFDEPLDIADYKCVMIPLTCSLNFDSLVNFHPTIDTLIYTQNDVTKSIVIPIGRYELGEIADIIREKTTISDNVYGIDIRLNSNTGYASIVIHPTFVVVESNFLITYFGFTQLKTNPITTDTIADEIAIVDLWNNMYVICDVIESNTTISYADARKTSNFSRNIACLFPLTRAMTGFVDMFSFGFIRPTINRRVINAIKFTLITPNGQPIDTFGRSLEFSVTCQIQSTTKNVW